MTVIHSVRIIGYEQRYKPKTHIVYHIEVRTSVRSWQLWRRYSEFVGLHNELRTKTGSEPPISLPPKRPFSFQKQDPTILKERLSGLERYLREILSSKDARWRELREFNEFLEVPLPTAHGNIGHSHLQQFTLSSWLEEHSNLNMLARDIMADITKRNSLVDLGDISGSQAANVSGKRKLVMLLDKLGILAKGLEDLNSQGLTSGELQRRNDMIASLQDDCERLQKMVSAIRSTSQGGTSVQTSFSHADRESLLNSQSPSRTMAVSRVFGAKQIPQETEQTRPLDDQGLLNLQKQQMEQQDDQAARLTTILRRQKQLGMAISQEIEEQNELLDDLTRVVDETSGKLVATGKDLRHLT